MRNCDGDTSRTVPVVHPLLVDADPEAAGLPLLTVCPERVARDPGVQAALARWARWKRYSLPPDPDDLDAFDLMEAALAQPLRALEPA